MPDHVPTIYDVAEACGVATSTVSRALSRPERVSTTTRKLVVQTADRIGYHPSPVARARSGPRSGTLTLTVSDIANPYYFGMVRGAQHAAAAAGYTLVLTDSDESGELEARSLHRLLATSAGCLLATSRLADAAIRDLAEHRPMVLLNRRIPGMTSVVADSGHSMRALVRHLAEQRHRTLAYLDGPGMSWANAARWTAIAAESRRLGLSAERLGPHPPTEEGGAAAVAAGLPADTTALITYNDLLAIGALRELTARRVPIPDRLSLAGCDDIFGADLTHPPLTTVSIPGQEVGRQAVDLLIEQMTGARRVPTERALHTQLLVRGTTGPAPASPG